MTGNKKVHDASVTSLTGHKLDNFLNIVMDANSFQYLRAHVHIDPSEKSVTSIVG